MRTTTKPRSSTKTVEFPKAREKRLTLAYHAVEGITTSELQSIAHLPQNERLDQLSTLARLAGGVAAERSRLASLTEV